LILPTIRDTQLITIRRGGSLNEEYHHLLALWAADCVEHVLRCFEDVRPNGDRPHRAVEAAHAWVRCEIKMTQARSFAGAAQDAARDVKGVSETARMVALSAGQAAVVAHIAEHKLGATAYALRAVIASSPKSEREAARLVEFEWQVARLPNEIRQLVLDDMRRRNDICWHVFA
jgi:hypothetical protein